MRYIRKFNEENLDKYGYVSYGMEKEFDGEKYILIDLVYVYPKYRRQGYAKKLITQALQDIKRKYPGYLIKLAAYPKENSIDMIDLVDFYEDLGFEVVGTSGHAVIMEY